MLTPGSRVQAKLLLSEGMKTQEYLASLAVPSSPDESETQEDIKNDIYNSLLEAVRICGDNDDD